MDKPDRREYRPTLRSAVTIFVGGALIWLFGLIVRNDVLTAFFTLAVCGGYLAWTFWDNRYK